MSTTSERFLQIPGLEISAATSKKKKDALLIYRKVLKYLFLTMISALYANH